MQQGIVMRLMLCVVLVVTLVGVIQPVTAQDSENLLQNGGFEGTYIAIGGDPSLQVAPNWQPWNLPPPPGSQSSAVNLRPDYQPAPANRVRSGNAAQEYNTFFATHDGGVFQRVPVTAGAELQFSAYVYVWSSATFENPNESIQPQEVDVQVGIDPLGGQDGAAESIIWSEPTQFYDEYRQLNVSATAQGNAITVFIRSAPQGSIGVNNVYVDDARLIQTGTGDVAPVPTEEVLESGNDTGADTTSGAGGDTTAGTGTTAGTDTASGTGTTAGTDTASGTGTTAGTDTASGTGTTAGTDTTASGTGTIPTEVNVTEAVARFPNRLTYTVQPGDTVLNIANRYQSTVEAISDANGLSNVGFIVVGQTLIVPTPAGVGQPATTSGTGTNTSAGTGTTGTTTTTTPGRHVVQAGENLYRIALLYNTSVEALASLNNITNPNTIFVGMTLQVPVTAGGTGGPTTTPTGAQTHVVRAGENAFRIGLQYNITVEQLALANQLINPNLIFTGQTLVIPR